MAKNKKNIVIANFPRMSREIWLPFLWTQAKTYYELYGERVDEWNWVPCFHDVFSVEYNDNIKDLLRKTPPDIFAVSLYVWNYRQAFEITAWVKETFPECVVISGGPHQHFKHNIDWFKKHPYLDASLPGDCYGELCFKEILDNYDNETKKVNWRKVTDMWYPSKGRMALTNTVSMSNAERRNYSFDWSSMRSQVKHMKEFSQYQQKHFPKSVSLAIIETTRGCPYGCTYCDWGGGTLSPVLKKSVETVKQDIDALMEFNLAWIFLADANFGIFGDRDVEIMKHIASANKKYLKFFKMGYSGFAKTQNKLKFIKEILTINIENQLTMTNELKISVQSLDDQVLKNIDRKNIPLEAQIEEFGKLAKDNKLPMYVEMIMALPGITLDKYYYEIDEFAKYKLAVQWFDWILLPESPAYAKEYREKFGMITLMKYKGWQIREGSSEREVVIGCKGLTTDGFLQMLISNGMYHMLVQGGVFHSVTNWIVKNKEIGFGGIIKGIYENWFTKQSYYKTVAKDWDDIKEDNYKPCLFDIGDGEDAHGDHYFPTMCFKSEEFRDSLLDYLVKEYNVPKELADNEKLFTITKQNFGKKKFRGLIQYTYERKFRYNEYSVDDLVSSYRHFVDSSKTQRARRKLLGIFPLKELTDNG